jgi:hypothetical protein
MAMIDNVNAAGDTASLAFYGIATLLCAKYFMAHISNASITGFSMHQFNISNGATYDASAFCHYCYYWFFSLELEPGAAQISDSVLGYYRHKPNRKNRLER